MNSTQKVELTFSIIVPVYNVEHYLKQCIDSIREQEYTNYECILVDDGSTDSSPKICDEYSRIDPRVKVIHKKNGGASDARNRGLEIASGNYIFFVDSDDYLYNSGVLTTLYDVIQSNSNYDFICFNRIYFYQKSNIFKQLQSYPKEITIDNDIKNIIVGLLKHGIFPISPYTKVIKRDFLVNNDIKFIEGLVGEDIPWFLELLRKAKNIKIINQWLYIYRKQVPGSVTSIASIKRYKSLSFILSRETQTILDSYSEGIDKNALLSYMAYVWSQVLAMTMDLDKSTRKYERKFLRQYDWLLNYDLNPKVKKVKLCYRIFGMNITALILSKYIKYIVQKN